MLHRSKKQLFAFCLLGLILCIGFFSISNLGQAASNEISYYQTILTPSSGYSQGYPAPVEITPQYISRNHRISLPFISSTTDRFTFSYYIKDLNTKAMQSLGCDMGQTVAHFPGLPKNGFVILDFGAPAYRKDSDGNYEYGTNLVSFGSPYFISHGDMWGAVTTFMKAYSDCASPIAYTHLDLAIGLYNANNNVMNDTSLLVGHAEDFGTHVRNLDNYSTAYLNDLIRVSLAMDVEHDPRWFADPGPTKAWLNSALEEAKKPFYNFGNADCSTNEPVGNEINVQPVICGPSEVPIEQLHWTQEDISIVSSLNGWGYPMPEIYDNNELNALQWYRIGIYSSMKNRPLVFRGTLTQWTACEQMKNCSSDDNEPSVGFSQMSKYVATLKATDTRVQNEMQWRTDMKHQPTLTPTPYH